MNTFFNNKKRKITIAIKNNSKKFNKLYLGNQLLGKSGSYNITNYPEVDIDLFKNQVRNNTIINFTYKKCIPSNGIDISLLKNNSIKIVDLNGDGTHLEVQSNYDKVKLSGDLMFLFDGAHNIISVDFSHFDTSDANNFYCLFTDCYALKEINFSEINTMNVENMSYMFRECNSLIQLDLSNFKTPKLTEAYGMFQDCHELQNIDMSNFTIENVTSISSMFQRCHKLKEINLDSFSKNKCTSLWGFFEGCYNLVSIKMNNFDFTNITSLDSMFSSCRSLTNLEFLSNWKVDNVTDISFLFNDCEKLTSTAGLRKWKLNNLLTIDGAFRECWSLTNIRELIYWNTSQVTDMSSLFNNCRALKNMLYIKNWDVSKVVDMSRLFSGTNLDIIDISKWNIQLTCNTDMLGEAPEMYAKNIEICNLINSYKSSTALQFTLKAKEFIDISALRELIHRHIPVAPISFITNPGINPGFIQHIPIGYNTYFYYFFLRQEGGNQGIINGKNDSYLFKGDCSNLFKDEKELVKIDLSYCNFSFVTNKDMNNMFSGCIKVTEAYARNQSDCDKLNESLGKPNNINFIVKPKE